MINLRQGTVEADYLSRCQAHGRYDGMHMGVPGQLDFLSTRYGHIKAILACRQVGDILGPCDGGGLIGIQILVGKNVLGAARPLGAESISRQVQILLQSQA